jgi:hypothetical protein
VNSYTNSDIARIEAATGLQFAGYLHMDGVWLPVFLKARSQEDSRAIVLRLNGRNTGQQAA